MGALFGGGGGGSPSAPRPPLQFVNPSYKPTKNTDQKRAFAGGKDREGPSDHLGG